MSSQASQRFALLAARKAAVLAELKHENEKAMQLRALEGASNAGVEEIMTIIYGNESLLTADPAASDLLGAKLAELASLYDELKWKILFKSLSDLTKRQLFPDMVIAVLYHRWLPTVSAEFLNSKDCERFIVWLLAFCSCYEEVIELIQEPLTAMIVYSLFTKKSTEMSLLDLYMAVPCQKQFNATVTACLHEAFASEEALCDLNVLRHAQPWFPFANPSSSLRLYLAEHLEKIASLTDKIEPLKPECALLWTQLYGATSILEILKESVFTKYERVLNSFVLKSEAQYGTLQVILENWHNITRAFSSLESCNELSEQLLNLVNHRLDSFNFTPKTDSVSQSNAGLQALSSTFSDVVVDRCSAINAHCSFGPQALSGMIPVTITRFGKSFSNFQILDDVLYVKQSNETIPISTAKLEDYL